MVVYKRAPRSHGLDVHSSIIGTLLIKVTLSTTHLVIQYPSNTTLCTPLCFQSKIPCRSFPYSVFVSYELSLCRAPMVTCGPSKQDKLCAHFPWLTLHDNKTPTRGSHHQPIQMSATTFEVADHYVNPHCFSPAQPLTRTRKQELQQRWSCDTG